MLTQEELKKNLHYDPKTGVFTRRVFVSSNRGRDGYIAGNLDAYGYYVIGVCGVQYLSHRLAWLYVYGYFPEHGLDHKDRIRHHNWIDNLREATQQCNVRNTGNPKNNTSGVKGVCWRKRENSWAATIVLNKHKKYLGCYKDFDEAVCARLAGEQCLDWANCDSSSPAYQYVQKMLNMEG